MYILDGKVVLNTTINTTITYAGDFVHPVSYTISGKKDAATPLFDWGKYVERQGRWMLVFTVQAHHSFVDGIPIGKLAYSIQKRLDAF